MISSISVMQHLIGNYFLGFALFYDSLVLGNNFLFFFFLNFGVLLCPVCYVLQMDLNFSFC